VRHGPPPLRGRGMCPLLAVGVSGSQRSSTVSALRDVFAQLLVNGVRRDVSGAHATVSGTCAGRDHRFESGDRDVRMSYGLRAGVRSSLTTGCRSPSSRHDDQRREWPGGHASWNRIPQAYGSDVLEKPVPRHAG
jgi:hypothetical protein